MSRGSSFDGFYKSMGEPPRPDEGNVLAAFGKGFDWAAAKALGSKRDMPTPLTEAEQAKVSGKGLDNIKGKTPTTNDLANMHLALGKSIYGDGHSEAGKAAGDAVIDRAISGEHPAAATKRAQDAHATHTAAARTAEVRPESHVATNPHLQQQAHSPHSNSRRFG